MYEAFPDEATRGKNLRKKIFSFFKNAERSGLFNSSLTDFTRSRILSFFDVSLTILHLFKESVTFNLQKVLPQLKIPIVTDSAFSQARYKINSQFFHDLSQVCYHEYINSNRRLWKGHTLIGVDGSTLIVKNTLANRERYGVLDRKIDGPDKVLVRPLICFDTLNHYVLGADIGLNTEVEKTIEARIRPSLRHPKNSVYIYDRGFSDRKTLLELSNDQRLFCMRVRTESNFIKSFLEKPTEDWTGDWPANTNYVFRHKDRRSFPIRLVRHLLTSGETAVYATNLLDDKKYSTKDIIELYALRWGVEEGFKKMKAFMKIEEFGAGKPEGVLQEFYAHIFYINLLAILGIQAQCVIEKQTSHRKYCYQFNWKNAYHLLRHYLIELILHYKKRDQLIDKMINLMSQKPNAVIPHRMFYRTNTMKGRRTRINVFYK